MNHQDKWYQDQKFTSFWVKRLALLPVSLFGTIGFAMSLTAIFTLLGFSETGVIFTFLNQVGQIGYSCLDLIGKPLNEGLTFEVVLFAVLAFSTIALATWWLIYLSTSWCWEMPRTNKIALKTFWGNFLGLVYYPLVVFGIVTLIIAFIS